MAGKKILMIDDNQVFCEIMKDLLFEKGLEVVPANDGVQGIEMLKAENFDLIMLDLLLPRMTGFDVLREIRKIKSTADVPVLAVSGVYQKDEHLASLKELGANGFVSKKLTTREIADRVIRTLEEFRAGIGTEAPPVGLEPPTEAPDKKISLENMQLFKDLGKAQLKKIQKIAREAKFVRGQVIMREGEQGDTFFGIVSGTVRVEKKDVSGKQTLVARLGPGAEFGELALIDNDRRSATCTAETDAQALAITREDFEKVLEKDPELERKCLRALLKILTNRLRETDTSLTFSRSLLEKVIETKR